MRSSSCSAPPNPKPFSPHSRLTVVGDLHDYIHKSDHWEYDPPRIRKDTYACLDEDGDYALYDMPRPEKISFGCQLAKALRECARNGIVHNDLKPANVLVLEKRGEGKEAKKGGGKKRKKGAAKVPAPARCRIKLIDFGEGGPPDKVQGFVCGTPGYIAPEVEE